MIAAARLLDAPIIHAGLLPAGDGGNINGPCLLLAPDWLPGRLGRFYLYFADHRGRYIRLAYSDALAGPWRVHVPGTLHLKDASACIDHIASPDVHVDEAAREIVMFFHGLTRSGAGQRTFVALSRDGVNFVAQSEQIADSYFRTAPWGGGWLGMSKGGAAYVSDALRGPYRRLPQPAFAVTGSDTTVRHVALKVAGNRLQVFYSRIGDTPECIALATVDLAGPRDTWSATDPEVIMRPERSWEGANLPLTRSRSGAARGPAHALRDPAVFCWEGRTYLLYAAAGESAIGIAELIESA